MVGRYHLCGIIAYTPVIRSFCHSVCLQDDCKSNQPISFKRGVITGPTNSGGDLCLTLGDEVGGLGDGSPVVGSRGRAPVGGLGMKSPISCELIEGLKCRVLRHKLLL